MPPILSSNVLARASRPMLACAVWLGGAVHASAGARVNAKEVPEPLIRGKEAASLSALVSEAEAIVLGAALSCDAVAPVMTPSGYVQSRLKVRVEESYKGALPAGALMTVTRWGGILRDAKGEWQKSQLPPGLLQVECDRQYVLFLRRAAGMNGFDVLGGPQGTFEIRSGKVYPLERERSLVQSGYGADRISLASLVDQIKGRPKR